MPKLFVFTFNLWKRGNNLVTDEARITAETIEQARVLVSHWHDEWIIGDCRHCAYA